MSSKSRALRLSRLFRLSGCSVRAHSDSTAMLLPICIMAHETVRVCVGHLRAPVCESRPMSVLHIFICAKFKTRLLKFTP